MRHQRYPALLLCLLCISVLYAQEDEEAPIISDWSGYRPNVYSRGDQAFTIGLGLPFPLFLADQEKGVLSPKMNMGGMVALGYSYFLGSRFFLGGELDGAFFSTEGKNNYFIVPMGVKAGFQFVLGRFEFPLSLMIGGAAQQRLGGSYFGLFVKPSASAFFRFNPDWSFGVSTGFWWVPQWTGTRDSDHSGPVNIHGFFIEAVIGARYHF